MTIIAYRNGVLAGDSCWCDAGEGAFCGQIVNRQSKIRRLRSGALYGGAGAVDDRELVEKLQNVRTPEDLPSSKWLAECEHSNVNALVVLQDETVWEVYTGDEHGGVMQINKLYAAIGCGGQIALGALFMGASAEQAVEAACALNVYCRLPVTMLELKKRRKRRDKL